jgi:hypothetical protein
MDSNSVMMPQSLFEFDEEDEYTEYSFYDDDGLSVIMEENSQCSSFIDDKSDGLGFFNHSNSPKSDNTLNTCNTSNSDGLPNLVCFDRSFGDDEWIEMLQEGSRPKQRPTRDSVTCLRTGEQIDMIQDDDEFTYVSLNSSVDNNFSLLSLGFTEEDIRILEEECDSSSERDEDPESMERRRPGQQEHSQEMIESIGSVRRRQSYAQSQKCFEAMKTLPSILDEKLMRITCPQRKQNYLESLKLLEGMMKRNKESKKKAERFSGLQQKENYKESKRRFEEMKQLPNADMRSLLVHRRHNHRRLRFKLFQSKLLKKIPQTVEQKETDIQNKRSQKWHESRPKRKIMSVKSNMRNSQRPDTPLPATKMTIIALPVFKLDLDLANTLPLLPSIAIVGDSSATAEPNTIKSEAYKPSPFTRRERRRAYIRDKVQRLELSILQLQLQLLLL